MTISTRVRRAVLPAALAVAAAACTTVGLRLDAAAEDGAALDSGRLVTPVLSARRIPGWVAEPVARERLGGELDAWLAQSPPTSCLVVQDAEGRPLYAREPQLPLVPASTQKLVTAGAALRALGGDHRFTTRVVTGPAPAEVLAGDLVLVGGGDPLLATADYAARFTRQPQTFTDLDVLAAAVASSGVRRVEGSVVGDESRFDHQRYIEGWPERYLDQDQIGPLSALTVNDGFEQYPTRDRYRELVPAPDPAANAAAVLTALLEARGVDVAGDPTSGAAPPDAREVAAVESAPLAEIVDQLLRESDNMTGELLLKAIGLDERGAGTTAAGAEAARALLGGLLPDGAALVDGSGLALENRVTCAQLVGLLVDDGIGDELVDGLPVAGRSGTLAERYVDTPLAGALRAKTGSLNAVTALAGVLDDDGGRLVFAYVANAGAGGRVAGDLVAAQQQLGEILLSYPRTPNPARLGPRPAEAR